MNPFASRPQWNQLQTRVGLQSVGSQRCGDSSCVGGGAQNSWQRLVPQFTKTDIMFGILREDTTAAYLLNTSVLEPLRTSFVLRLSGLSERGSSKVPEYDLDD